MAAAAAPLLACCHPRATFWPGSNRVGLCELHSYNILITSYFIFLDMLSDEARPKFPHPVSSPLSPDHVQEEEEFPISLQPPHRCRRPQRRRRLKYSRSEEGGGGIFCAFIVVIPLQEGHRLCYGDLKILEKGTYILAKIKEETCTFCTNVSTQCYLRYAIPLILLRSCFMLDQYDPKV